MDLLLGLRDIGNGEAGGSRMAISVTIEGGGLFFDPNDKAVAAAMADEIVAQVKANLLNGQRPDGTPLPGIDQDTAHRRELEAGQGSRGGEAAPRYVDSRFRAKVQRNFKRDYTAARLGQFTPRAGGPRGVVSGMLASSFMARPSRDGKTMTIYVAAKRGKPRPGESISALQAVFGQGGSSVKASSGGELNLMNDRVLKTPRMRMRLNKTVKSMIGAKPTIGKSLESLLQESVQAIENLQSLSEE